MSTILIVGGTGFMGRHLAAALTAAGHAVTASGRRDLDLVHPTSLAARLPGFEVVINCAGIVRSRGDNSMRAVHDAGAARLFEACLAAGVRLLLHVSALGADAEGATTYQRSKGAGERNLAALDPDGRRLDWCILRPSVVIGRGGASTGVLAALATLPLPPRIGRPDWLVQPVHVGDLADLVARLVDWRGPLPRRIDVVGPERMNATTLVATLRHWLGLPQRPFVPVPELALRVVAAVGERFADGPVNREILAMLAAGNVADPAPLATALGRPPRRLRDALAMSPASVADRWHARLFFLRAPLRWSLGLLWVVTGLVSFGVYPVAESHRLLAAVGLAGLPADVALYGAASLDLALGLLLLARWRPALIGALQLAAMTAFTLIAVALPAEYWLHPFAPLLKNLPLAVATLAMMAMEV